MKNIIYALVDPRTEEIRYIGKSTSGLSRPKGHFTRKRCLNENNHKAHWVNNVLSDGLEPRILVLHEADNPKELFELEIKYIKEYREKGAKLTNLTDGGEGNLGWVMPKETRKKISEKAKNYNIDHFKKYNDSKRKEHTFIDGIESKHCCDCDDFKSILDFHINRTYWDNLNKICKECANKRKRERDARNRKVLTEEEWKQSYVDRREKMRAGVIAAYENHPELKTQISEQRKKPVLAENIETKEVFEFDSGLEAEKYGFNHSSVSEAIRLKRPYKGFVWYFKYEES